MDKNILEPLIEQGLTVKEISALVKKSKTNVLYWLKKLGLKTKRGPKGKHPKDFVTKRHCKCGNTDPNLFYGNKKAICADCHNKYNAKKGRDCRKRALEYLGGECRACGFKKFPCSIDIHHLNPEIKDTSFRHMRYWRWEKLEKELQKCILLCRNCHNAHHNGYPINWTEFPKGLDFQQPTEYTQAQ